MLLAALLDLAPIEAEVRGVLGGLAVSLPPFRCERVRRGGIAGLHLVFDEREAAGGHSAYAGPDPHADAHHGDIVHDHSGTYVPQHRHSHAPSHSHDQDPAHLHAGPARTLPDVMAILEGAPLSPSVRERAERVFRSVAEAEAQIHGKGVDEVHFHEISGADTILDVLGVLAALEVLGIDRVSAGPISVGQGTIRVAHGEMPLPAPATAELLEGIPVRQIDVEAELTTPTGAALLAEVVDDWGPAPPMRSTAIGYGAGTRDLPGRSNTVRMRLGQTGGVDAERDSVAQLVFSVDDMTGEASAHLVEALMAAGAVDVALTPATMKKGRPGQVVTVLAPPAGEEAVIAAAFRESSTFGLRREILERVMLARSFLSLEVAGQPVRVKVGRYDGTVRTVAAEHEDCRRAAEETGLPLAEVRRRAEAMAHERLESEPD
jgi:hypothetical protein